MLGKAEDMRIKSLLKNIAHSLRDNFANNDLDLSQWDAVMLSDFYSYNLTLCMTAAAMLCILSLIGFIGTFAPYSTGFINQTVNATLGYLLILCPNVTFFLLFQYTRRHLQTIAATRQRRLFIWFTGIDMILASITFFTTQADSSFFFEYVLMTIIIYLVPNAGMFSFFRNMVINITSVLIVLAVTKYSIAWQDQIDIIALQVICAFVNHKRLQGFVRREKEKLSIEKQREQYYHESRTDELTHIANRMALRNDFPGFLNHPVCVALIDLDDFKQYNDFHGHAYGDKVLTLTGRYLHRIFHDETDHCYRYGGDEFLIISENEDPVSFRARLNKFQMLCGTNQDDMEIPCCIGYYSDLPHSAEELRGLIKKADSFLYQAKDKGGCQINGGSSDTVSDGIPGTTAVSSADASVDAGYDPLTGLLDMHAFLDVMQKERRQMRDVSADGELAVLYFDLINFRMINLLYGMSYGDETLRIMGKSLQGSFPDSVISRWDVDHFAVLTDTRNLEKRTKDALERIKRILPFHTECSVGACIWSDHSLETETVCTRARAASDESRKGVGSHFSYYTKAIGESLNTSAYVVSHIDEAVQKRWIVVYYQPVVRALSGQICGMEALARWKDPERGLSVSGSFRKASGRCASDP